MMDETWAWEAGVLYENGVPLATATRECGILHARMIVAAPDMARALAETERVLNAWHKDRGEWATLREHICAALAKAGVLLVDTRPTLPHSGGH